MVKPPDRITMKKNGYYLVNGKILKLSKGDIFDLVIETGRYKKREGKQFDVNMLRLDGKMYAKQF